MFLVYILACFGYKQQIADLEMQVQMNNAQLAVQQQAIEVLQARVATGTVPVDPQREEAAVLLLRQASEQLSQLAEDTSKLDSARELFKQLEREYADTKTWQRAKRMSAELDVFGKAAPTEWGLEEAIQGEWSYDAERLTYVIFWEEWCPHCKREVPNLQQFHLDYTAQGLDVVGVTKLSRNGTIENTRGFLEGSGVTYPMFKEDGRLSEYMNVSGIPAAVLIKGDIVIWRGHPARITEEVLQAYLQ